MNQAHPLAKYVVACALLWLLGTLFFLANAGHVELHVSLESDNTDFAQTYYSFNGQWNESDSAKSPLVKGVNQIVVTLPGLFAGPAVRFDPGQKPGHFRLSHAYWTVGATRIPVDFASINNAHPLASEMTASDTDVTLDAHDDDPQLIVPTPPPTVRIGNITRRWCFWSLR